MATGRSVRQSVRGFNASRVRVLYEDNHLVAVYKPSGTLVQADSTKDPTLIDEVKYYLKQEHHKPGRVWLGLIHRLDRPVAGIILFAKTSKGAARISEQMRCHTLKKIYHALVIGRPPEPHGTLVHFLKKDPKRNMVQAFTAEQPEALRAELDYELIKAGERFSLLKIQLKTGRPHQIRAQLSAIGCPVVGDVKYGAPEPLPDRSVALAATSLSFELATKAERQTVEIPVPEEWSAYL